MNATAISGYAACLSMSVACSASTGNGLRSPSVAFGASASDIPGECSLEGMPRVVATHVVPNGSVKAMAADGMIWLSFATTHHPFFELAVDPESLDVVDAGEMPAKTAPGSASLPVQVALEEHRHIVAWTEGSTDKGLSVKFAAVADDGSSAAAMDLGYEGSATGRPVIAVTPEGRGILAFVESNGVRSQLVVTRANCAMR
jgi:hypothetical protein